jgi:hypothetical protein
MAAAVAFMALPELALAAAVQRLLASSLATPPIRHWRDRTLIPPAPSGATSPQLLRD